jgi:hypothetical protein
MQNRIRRLIAFLSPAAFERRARDRERKLLGRELDDLDEKALYDRQRRPVIEARLQTLNQQDASAWLSAIRYAPGETASAAVDFGRVQGNFIFCTGSKDALKPDTNNRRYRAPPVDFAVLPADRKRWAGK